MGVFLQKSPAPCVLWTKLCHFHGPVIREGSRKYPWIMWEVKRPQPCFSNACQLFCGYSIRAHVFPEVEWLVENLSLFFFFFLLSHLQNQSVMPLSVQCSLDLDSFSHFLPRLLLREWMSENFGKSCCISAQFTGHVLYFGSLY